MRRVMIVALILMSCACITAAAKSRPRMVVQTDWLASHLKNANVAVIHVGRDQKVYEEGHIPGARFLALSEIAVTKNGIPNELPSADKLKEVFERLGVSNGTRVVFYGDHAGLYASRAYFTLDYLGVAQNASLLDGGLEKWKSESRPTSKEAPKVTAAKLKIKVRPELVMDSTKAMGELGNKNVKFIDARPFDEYSGTKAADGVSRPGHIPGAENVFWMNNLQSEENPVLKSADEIRANYSKAGLKPGDTPVVYCRTGVQAAHDYFTLKLLGYEPVLYDGSYFEWSGLKDAPVEGPAEPKKSSQ